MNLAIARQAVKDAVATVAASAGHHGAMVASRDGLAVAASWPAHADVDTAAAMAAALAGAGETLALESAAGAMHYLTITTDKQVLSIHGLDSELLLIIAAEAGAARDVTEHLNAVRHALGA